MRISAKCSVAIHCLLLISEYSAKLKITSELAAESTGCNPAAIRSILNALKKAGLICIRRGVGGAVLSRAPEEISVWDIYQAVEPDGLERMMGVHPNPSESCPVGKRIETVLETSYAQIEDAVAASMRDLRLSDFVGTFREMKENHLSDRDTRHKTGKSIPEGS